ncbi:MAG: sigma-70 family RNA polymerase sigma factor [Phycisphaerae bacterium]|nr:sigma-70 family RNA polymerase sigma factor [Phycisphaerae bacterium]
MSRLSSIIPVTPGSTPPLLDRRTLLAEFQRLAGALHRFVAVRVRDDRAAADDLMQQLWLEADRGVGRMRIEDHEAWLRGIARNVLRRYWRENARAARTRPLADAALAAELAAAIDEREIAPQLLEQEEVRDQVRLALTLLAADEQDLIIRAHFRAQTHEQIAGELRISARAVEGRLYRARRMLKERLAHLNVHEEH